MSTPSTRRYLPWLTAFLVIIADQVTKWIVQRSMELHESIPFIGEVVRWTYIHNRGMAFGVEFLTGRLLGIISILATLLFTVILVRARREPLAVQLIIGGIIGGAIGNTIDRLRFGYVIDFIDVDLPDWLMERWPVFNIADSAVSVGVVLLILILLFSSSRSDRKQEDPEAAGRILPESERTVPAREDD